LSISEILREVNERGLLRDDQFGFRPRHSTTLQLAHLVGRVNRNPDENRKTGAVFLNVAKASRTTWIKGLTYKLTVLTLSSYLVNTISHMITAESSKRLCGQPRPHVISCAAGLAQGELLFPVLFYLYVNDILAPSRHVGLAQYADNMALVATPRSTSLLVGYLEACVGRLELWLRDWRIVIDVWKSIAVLFVETARHNQKTQATEVFRKVGTVGRNNMMSWGDPRYAAQLDGARQPGRKKGGSNSGRAWPLHLHEKWLFIRNGVLFCNNLVRPVTNHDVPSAYPVSAQMSGSCRRCSPSVFALRLTHVVRLVTGKFTGIWGFHFSPTISEH
jgi:hypothetical protein